MAKNKEKKTKKNDSVISFQGRRFKNGSYSASMILIAIAIMVFVNLIVSKIPTKYTEYDVTSAKLYTISDTTKEFLKGLDEDVTIYYLISSTQKDYAPLITKLVEQYEKLSSHITLEYKDPDLYPTFGSQYEATSDTVMIIESAKRHCLVSVNDLYSDNAAEYQYGYAEEYESSFNGESVIANAVSMVTADKLPKVYELAGEGELQLEDSIKELIEKANISVNEINLLSEGKVPEDCDCLLLISPTTDLTKDAKDAILSYLDQGGNAIVCSDYSDKEMPNLKAVVEAYGVTVNNGVVFESGQGTYASTNPTFVIPEILSTEVSDPILDGKYEIIMPSAQSITELEDKRDSITVKNVLQSSNASYVKKNLTKDTKTEMEDGDIPGPCTLGVMITDTHSEDAEATDATDEKTTKLMVFGSSSLVSGELYTSGNVGAAKLFISALGWTCDSKDAISITSKSLVSETLTINGPQTATIATIYILIPVLVVIIGVVVVVKRTRR